MTLLWAVSASDALLAITAFWVSVRLFLGSLPTALRIAATASSLLVTVAAVFGCLRFAGFDDFTDINRILADQSAIIALPVLLIASAWTGLSQKTSGKLLAIASVLLVGMLIFLQLRVMSGAFSIVLAAITVLTSRKDQRRAPLSLLFSTLLLAGVAVATSLPVEHRIILIHLVLAMLMLSSLATVQTKRTENV